MIRAQFVEKWGHCYTKDGKQIDRTIEIDDDLSDLFETYFM
jgi:hypothetical protein